MARYKHSFTLEADPSTTSVVLTWVAPQGPTPVYYDVIRDSATLATRGGSVLTYTDTAVTAGATYTYQIRGRGSFTSEGSGLSNPVTVTVLAAPKPVTAPVLTGTSGAAQASLSWTAVPNADSYSWQRATGAGAFGSSTDTALLTATDGTVASGTLYRFRVRGSANAGADTGPWSNIVSVTPTTGVPVAPTLTGTEGDSLNNLDWNSVANAATFRLRRQVGTNPMTIFPDTAATDFTDDTAANGITYQYTVRGITAGGVLGSVSAPVDLTPVAGAVSPPDAAFYAGFGAQTTGGAGGTTYNVSTWAEFRARIEQSGPRIVKIVPGTGNLDGQGDTVSIVNPNLTIDGTGWTKSIKRAFLRIQTSNVIITQMRLRPGDQVDAPDDVDCLSIIPPSGQTIERIVVDHCSLLWAPDVTMAILNAVRDVTVQYSILGAGLRESAHFEAAEPIPGHSYGPNVSTIPASSTTPFGERITFFRNYICHNRNGRNMRGVYTRDIEYVNNVVYNWGIKMAHMNPRSGNFVGNMLKKGPGTRTSNSVAESDGGAGVPFYQNAVWFPLTGSDANIGLTAAGAAFTPTLSLSSGTARTSRAFNDGATLNNLVPASTSLATAIVAAAGPTSVDVVDQGMKDDYTSGDGDYWNGPSGPTPHPYWP